MLTRTAAFDLSCFQHLLATAEQLLQVALSAQAVGLVSACSSIFTAATMAKLGSNAICAVDSQKPELKQLVILLQVGNHISPLAWWFQHMHYVQYTAAQASTCSCSTGACSSSRIGDTQQQRGCRQQQQHCSDTGGR